MTHEPECIWLNVPIKEPEDCGTCERIRAAYRRGVADRRKQSLESYAKGYAEGRLEAAEAVKAYMEHESFCWTDPGPVCICQKDGAVAAALGVNE